MSSDVETPPIASGATFDVIVVGGRAAGAATALLLAQQGLSTLVLEQGAPGADTLSTHALMRGGVLQLARWGLLGDIVAAGTPAVRRATFTYADERVAIGIKPTRIDDNRTDAIDALYAPRRTVLDPVLVRAAAAAGATIHHRTSVKDLLTRNGRVVGVRATTDDGSTIELHSRLVVGADGIRSIVARRARAEYIRTGSHAMATSYGYWSDLDVDGFEWVFRPNACAGVIPTNGGQACVFASASPRRIGAGGIGLITDIVAAGSSEIARRLGAATPPSGTRTWSGHRAYLRRAFGRGWALVGDAGYFKDPISAHGLTDALRDAELLARAIVEGIDDDAAMVAALGHYQATRDRLSIPMFDIVERIAGNEWDDRQILSLLVRLSESMTAEVELLAGLDALQPV